MNEKSENNLGGRPTDYSEELAKRICDLIATHSHGLKKLCSMFSWMPDQTTIHEWRWKKPGFSLLYKEAKLAQADLLAEDCIDISDDASQDIILNRHGDEICNTEFVSRSRLRVDTRKWMAAKLLPKMYGDPEKQASLENENADLKEEMKQLRAELDEKNKKEY